MKKIVYSPVQVLTIVLLVLCGISLLAGDNVLKWDRSGNPCVFPYMRQGEYTLTVHCTPSERPARVSVFSDEATGADGKAGVVLATAELEPGEGTVYIPLALDQGMYGVCVATDLDGEEQSMVTLAHLESADVIYRDGAFLGSLCFLAAGLLGVIFAKVPREKYLMPLTAVMLGLLAGIPLYAEFIIDGNDFNFHIMRIEGMYQALASGDFPVRLNPAQVSGYGYLSSTMYPQLFLYPAAFLRFLNVSAMTCYKILLTMINVGTALTAYYSVKKVTGSDKAGILMSFLYTFSAYRLLSLYVRAALGEAMGMVFFPVVLWGVYECLWGQKRWIILALGMTGILQSHVLSTEMCAFFMLGELFWWLVSQKKKEAGKRILAGVKAMILALLLNASFLVPFLYFSTQDLKCFQLTNASANSVLYFSQMFSLFLNANGSSMPRGTTVNDMSLTVGTALLAGLVIFLVWAGSGRKETDKKLRNMGMHCAVYALAAMFLCSWLMPWGALIARIPMIDRMTASLQFVWRFLGPASFFLAVCTAVGLVKIVEGKEERNWLVGVVVVLCLVTSWSLFDNLKEFPGQHADPMEMEAVVHGDDMYLYNGTSISSYTRETAVPGTALGTEAVFSDYRKEGTHISLEVAPLEGQADQLVFPLYYYPGYEIRVNGEKAETETVNGLLACRMPDNRSKVEVKYTGLPFFRLADLVSIITCLGMAVFPAGKRLWKSGALQKKIRNSK